ncbi:hypothetical protein GWK47_013865 [Chionoecetes opilio]|uniref:Uncharacterized protein n=1 Tax=Chionoecetes opilio TaxID=41210 RepID=A0A8J4XTQ7_CHIOP|nr:hypothetical protein GWK47_013865 [Chionoecetes opilio]
MMMMMMMAEGNAYDCQVMRGECLLETVKRDGGATRNISCYCVHNEDVSGDLEELSGANCMDKTGLYVNTSILHIVGCNVSSQVFPRSVLDACRQSKHMVVHVEGSSGLSLPSGIPSDAAAPSTINATFIHSHVSGMPEGIVSGADVQATVVVEGGTMGVVESRAFSGYARDAQVSVTFRNTKILTVKQGAFDLPPAARVEMQGGQVRSFRQQSFSGGAELTLSGVVVGNLMGSSLNIHGLRKLHVTNCTMATAYAHALEHRPPSYLSTMTAGQQVLEGSEAVFSGNTIMKGNGQAFAQLCTVARLTWHNNTVLAEDHMPLTLQDPECGTKRDWPTVFSLTALSCINCTDFTNPDSQTCAMYKSGYCIYCEKEMDECNKPILPYLTTKCLASHPDIATDLNNTCGASSRTSKALVREAAAPSLAPLMFVVALGVTVVLAVPE